MNRVRPNTGIKSVFAMNIHLSVDTCSQSSGNCSKMNRKKHSNSALVTCALAGR